MPKKIQNNTKLQDLEYTSLHEEISPTALQRVERFLVVVFLWICINFKSFRKSSPCSHNIAVNCWRPLMLYSWVPFLYDFKLYLNYIYTGKSRFWKQPWPLETQFHPLKTQLFQIGRQHYGYQQSCKWRLKRTFCAKYFSENLIFIPLVLGRNLFFFTFLKITMSVKGQLHLKMILLGWKHVYLQWVTLGKMWKL